MGVKILQSGIKNVEFGVNVKIVKPVNLYGCKISNNVSIGPFVEIQKDVIIGNNCKIQSHSFINDVFKDGKPARGNKTKWKQTIIGNNVSIGTNATILPVNICDNVVVGAGAVVTKDITEAGTYVGNPAKRL